MAPEAVVHVVDDDLAVRQSLSFLLASDGLPVRLHESATAFLASAVQAQAGCIVTDVRMPGLDGIAFLQELRRRGSTLPVIVMTGHADVPLAISAMKAGAVDFLEKPFDDDLFLAAVRTALDRNAEEARRVAEASALNERLSTLSERERQVLAGLVDGKANKVIAFELGISPRTVEIYRANVMAKMQAASLSQLVRMVLVGEGAGERRDA
ncbi:response regulator transcription factor FixJ [Chelatococcus daeguensis]|uniref:DNA-binding response regulator n=1 Tax=Chelatococcus daeguensis TaxID=444444 RepID=A0AAC9NYC6_9HYPH|nr:MULTISPECIES: response regulator FixJ [Chelatococcus]APF36998.1 DNA-binding response regulator [Chelatococcus daeguensis]KZE33641.1 two-component system response regulator [Chelatococcus daeguensis]MBM3084774.1 response regulator transcription factor FixJ [Chelatococcus daeguensis]